MSRTILPALVLSLAVTGAYAQSTTPSQTAPTAPSTTTPAPSTTPPTTTPSSPAMTTPTPPAASAPSAPPAINATTLERGANSFTEAQARTRLEEAGLTGVTDLKKDDQGIWRGRATRNGAAVSVGLDFRGNISAQ